MTGPLLLIGADDRAVSWQKAFAEVAPHIDLRVHQPGQNLSGIPYCLSWRVIPGLMAQIPDLKVIFGLGAGNERLLADPTLPAHVPVVRMVEPGLTQGMIEYVLWQVLFHHRRVWELEEAQAESTWRPHVYPASWDRTVGILGLGELGSAVAAKLVEYGFIVRGWSRTSKSVPKVTSFAGAAQLPEFLSTCEILVCLLPLTAETHGILNAATLAQLPKGASLINAARGGHVVDTDLLVAMKSGHIQAATLDVFTTEPLPRDHPFWSMPRLFITPHNASITNPTTAAKRIAEQIARFESGGALENVVDRTLGY